MTVHIASAPGRKARPVIVDAAACTGILRDVGIAAEGIRQAQATIDAITGPAGRHAAGILADLADDDEWGRAVTARQARRDQPSCLSTWTPAPDLPTFACTLRGVHGGHESRADGGRLLAAWAEEDADQRGEHPYPAVPADTDAAVEADRVTYFQQDDKAALANAYFLPERAAELLSRPAVALAAKEGVVSHWVQVMYRDGKGLTGTSDDVAEAISEDRARLLREFDVDWTAPLVRVVNEVRFTGHQSAPADDFAAGPRHDPDAERAAGDDSAMTCCKCRNAPALDDDVICAACAASEAQERADERSAR